jgi:hypothetical protein
LAWESSFDMVFLQEPWSLKGNSKSHPGYDLFSPPILEAPEHPRVMTYCRKDLTHLLRTQINKRHLQQGTLGRLTWVNLYRRPGTGDIFPELTEILSNLPPATKLLLAGDFNAVHWTWQPDPPQHPGRGEDLAQLFEEFGLTVLNKGGPTYTAGNTLDLAVSNIPGIVCVRPDLYTGSDHYTIAIQCRVRDPRPRPNLPHKVALHNAWKFASIVQRYPPGHPEIQTVEQLEAQTDALLACLCTATRVMGKTPLTHVSRDVTGS